MRKQLIDVPIVYASDLAITWGNDSRYWRWVPHEDHPHVKVAELIIVYWLEVRGRYKMSYLEPWEKYEAFFVLKLKKTITQAITFTLEPPGAPKQERKVDLSVLPRNEWIRVKIGEFKTKEVGQSADEVKFSLTGYDDHPLLSKEGLVIEGVVFLPVF